MTTVQINQDIIQQLKPKGNDAANELWGLIQGSSPRSCRPKKLAPQYTPRFAEAQKNRTVHHSTLKQPSSEDEALFLKNEQPQSSQDLKPTFEVNDAEANLVRRLSAALLGAHQYSSTGNFGNAVGREEYVAPYDKGILVENNFDQSPTSTLHFPDSSSSNMKCTFQEQPPCDNVDYYCSFTNEDSKPQNEANIDGVATKTQAKSFSISKATPENATELEANTQSHTFVVCADPQLGMTNQNREWDTEKEYCRAAVRKINALRPRPKFACVCGDLVNKTNASDKWDQPECDKIRKGQTKDFKDIMSQIHPDIALVCLCGNHDVGNRPTPETISQYRNDFGDEYLAFWTNGTYNIVLNNVLFNNPDGALEMFDEQLEWLEERLKYANKFHAAQIYIFAHHPWFLYDENYDADQLVGVIPFPTEWNDGTGKFDNIVWPDSYFCVPKKYRTIALDLFKKYNVTACFCGHFHQNLVSKTSWGMDMIVTGPISMTFESTANKQEIEKGRGIRIVDVYIDQKQKKRTKVGEGSFTHRFENF
uniref:Calcineurin-like phosphoesterase domain-containing protein n=1 Tax=Eucampia antarctica TaxID=49252 RepID=A0A7S2R502_9STRA|mmetsp:Transcript_16762/g.16194  ORF Transcript_16762/g.16194 Transcript_16762/m.16194 type:complete len:535 (+) Transcript_16762:318-1922(+)|eukprot:CAMPEP_0197837040 /NCGR_PEP_ID=MMETSP1437-20131217/30895_1 /TAXON_ID=49252 ORGANISM="Eucampia antarctica, Strain CCMP1452" /NCGR_SAMPLE_ID=MMETSP1437 /ASSEMBLY_ACC=CAM_ASM_001096 /LENGTH=534 /DNA_ID=CAMNT_0043443725 /DNA_START=318 /DNA_END=1922 /DNA_ORIENTATION=-